MAQEKVICWKNRGGYRLSDGRKPTHSLQAIHVDNFNGGIELVIQKGNECYTVNLSIEHAQSIGFINLDALKDYCK